MWGIYRKEMRAYLISPIPYIVVIIFTALMAVLFFFLGDFFVQQTATMDRFFMFIPWVFIFLVPALAMRLWSEEVRGGTMETLLTMPTKSWQLVGGKFLSAWTLLFFCLLCTLPIAITVSSLGDLDWGPVIGGYLGALLMGGALLAMGIWLSSLTGHQIVSFLVAAVATFVLIIMNNLTATVGSGLAAFFEQVSVASRFEAMGRGVIDFRDVLYFVCFTLFFLYLNTVTVEDRRYR